MRLETNRLIMRELRHDDYGVIHEILSDEETMRHYPHPFDAEETRHWIRKNMDRYIKDGFGLWAVELKENGQLIGDCGITMQNIHGNIEPEIGYHIKKNIKSKGMRRKQLQHV